MKIPQRFIPLLLAALLTGCAVGPTYHTPTAKTAPQWYAAVPHDGKTTELVDWWQGFNDSTLIELQKSAETNNPTLAQAVARIDAARANLGISTSALLPALNGAANQTRSNNANGSESDSVIRTRSGIIDASWEIDLWGGLRAGRRSSDAQLSARTLDWHAARTSIAAEVANTYVAYRACQAQSTALLADVTSREETARLTALLVKAGFNAPAEGYLTDASAATGRQQQVATAAECELNIKSLVALTTLSEPEVRDLLNRNNGNQPLAPAFTLTAIPVSVISQRPDVASAERALASASAQINVAQANRLPRLSLLGNISFFGVKLSGDASQINSKTWSFGPSLSLPIFDAGQRAAQADVAKAGYAEALANYRQTVAQAVKEVESALVSLNAAQKRLGDANVAKNQFDKYFNASVARQRAGTASLIDLEDARRSKLSADQNLINLKREYTSSWIALYKAVGGSWLNQNQIETTNESVTNASQESI